MDDKPPSKKRLMYALALFFVAMFAFVFVGVSGSMTKKASICHVDEKGEQTLVIPMSKVMDHLGHKEDKAAACIVVVPPGTAEIVVPTPSEIAESEPEPTEEMGE